MRKGNKKKYMNGIFTYFSHDLISLDPVFYTHLDVDKRQELHIYARHPQKVADVVAEGAHFHDTITSCVKASEAVITICLLYTSRCV